MLLVHNLQFMNTADASCILQLVFNDDHSYANLMNSILCK